MRDWLDIKGRACAGGAVRVVPYAVTYPKFKSVLGHERPKIDLKREDPLKYMYVTNRSINVPKPINCCDFLNFN